MTDLRYDVLLIGGGVASAAAAVELREQGFDGSVALLTRELRPPYHRPPVSKELLGPKADEIEISVLPAQWWSDHDVELRTRSAVTALDTNTHTATLANKSLVRYGSALLATGAMVRRLSSPGSALSGIHYLRAPGNAKKLRAEARTARRAVLVGGSFIAAEVAASLTAIGVECTMVMPEHAPLQTAFGDTVADHVARLLTEHGVRLVCGEQVSEFTGSGAVDGVRTTSGRHLPADLVVVGVGGIPDTKLAVQAGLRLGDTGGIHCDSTLRASAADHYAAGDVCEYDSMIHGRRIRVEHEEHAAAQGVTAAHGLLSTPRHHREVPYFWTDLADWARLEYVGPAGEWDHERITGSLAENSFTVWYEHRGRVVAALTQGRPADLDLARTYLAADQEPAR